MELVAAIAFALSVVATSYGVGRVPTDHHTTQHVAIRIFGLALSALIVTMFVQRHRRHKERTTTLTNKDVG
jgi:heme/copper-type cytochrome/quinol oxidase subunit 4